LVLLGIGCIIGTGIFVLTGRAAAEFAGPGIMVSFVLTGILCALVALCYSELAAAIPVSGSAYVASLLHDLGITIPAALTAAPGVQVKDLVTGEMVTGIVNLPALLGIV